MKMIKVKSSNLDMVGYDKSKKVLRVKFKTGTLVYEYKDVPEKIYKSFQGAKSLGSFFAHNIKNGFSYLRLDQAALEKERLEKWKGKKKTKKKIKKKKSIYSGEGV